MAESVSSSPKAPRKMSRHFWGLLIIALVVTIWGEAHRVVARNTLRQNTTSEATPIVVTVSPTPSALGEELVLPGTVQAYIEAPIYARTSGYLKTWSVDIGSTVKKGQLLAEIDTPEVDQQLAQAIADLATARANEALARTTNARWKELLATEIGIKARCRRKGRRRGREDRHRGVGRRQCREAPAAGIIQAGRRAL